MNTDSPDQPTPVRPPTSDAESSTPLDSIREVSVNGDSTLDGESQMNAPFDTSNPAPVANPLDLFAASLAPKRAVSYLRVSTKGQASRGADDAEGFSIPAQREANKKEAQALGALIVKEFVDRGASAKSADRPYLKEMLEYVEDGGIDVIVHKVDRLARNREDDVEIGRKLRAAGVTLVSTTESIDQSPSGMLLHGIMASIAEFYSRNLATEVIKGMNQKAKRGGTAGKAPLGYRNIGQLDDNGAEIRTVIVDPERGPLMREAFRLYATGEWTVASLTEHLRALGLTTQPGPSLPSKRITEGLLHKLLTNPYFTGIVTFRGAVYPGRHEPLTDAARWRKVQDILASHVNGERTRKHPHYLRSTVYCGLCEERLLVQISKSKTGERYPYFVCAARHNQRSTCEQRSVLITDVEKKIEQYYQRAVRLSDNDRSSVERLFHADLQAQRRVREEETAVLIREKEKLERTRAKLLEAHYADAIPLDLLRTEQDRISSALDQIANKLHRDEISDTDAEYLLANALSLLQIAGLGYLAAPEHVRRQLNQAFFKKVLVFRDEDARDGVRVEVEMNERSRPCFVSLLTERPATQQSPLVRAGSTLTPHQANRFTFLVRVSVTTFWRG